MDTQSTFDRITRNIVEHTTRAELPAFEVLARNARKIRPGAAAALVDWNGAEVVRLRAFGVVVTALREHLSPDELQNLCRGLEPGATIASAA